MDEIKDQYFVGDMGGTNKDLSLNMYSSSFEWMMISKYFEFPKFEFYLLSILSACFCNIFFYDEHK